MKWQKYRKSEAQATPPRPFSQLEALDKVGKVHAELDQAGPWPDNLMAWLDNNHQGSLQAIRTAIEGVDHACLNQDATGLDRALAEYKQAWLGGLTLWQGHETL